MRWKSLQNWQIFVCFTVRWGEVFFLFTCGTKFQCEYEHWGGQRTHLSVSVQAHAARAHHYNSIAGRLSELAQTALSAALSHSGRYSNALLKYDTLPWHHTRTMYNPLHNRMLQLCLKCKTLLLPCPTIQDLNEIHGYSAPVEYIH